MPFAPRSRRAALVPGAIISTPAVVAATLGLFVTNAPHAFAQSGDVTIGGDARTFAMGGAGIALLPARGVSGRANPASLGYEDRAIIPTFPSLGVRSDGPITANAASSYLMNGTKGSDALSIAAQYGSAPSDLGVSGFGALRMGKLEISANAVGIAHIQPNSAWSSWVSSGSKYYTDMRPDARADIYAAGYYTLPSVAMGAVMPTRRESRNTVALGFRVKEMVGVYSHRIADAYTLNSTDGTNTRLAPEMAGSNQLTRKGVGADLGMMIRPRNGVGLSFATVVGNAVRPSFIFPVKDDAGRTLGQYDILQTTVSAGIGYQTRYGFTFAADLVDIGSKRSMGSTGTGQWFGATGQEMRLGIEQRVFGSIALRGGYSDLTGPTCGLGFGGLDVAIGKKVPLEVLKTLRF